jgi:serine phosphatase RsbU (regulator of sigma subunit)
MAARYLPAARNAQVGGDWYDAFPLPCGATMLVIGDVAGHDVAAAATMAETRGVLRGIAQTGTGGPAATLRALDGALERLGGGTPITAVAATVAPGPHGGTLLRWSNAGHPAPALTCADGTVEVLERAPELLLGVDADAPRRDHELLLHPGDTLLLYTDGLIERRGVPLDEGTAWLARALAALAGRPLPELCDTLLADVPGRLADDVAVLAARIDG